MTASTSTIHDLIRETLGAAPTSLDMVGGGMINQAANIEVSGTRYFIKWKLDAPPRFFEVESRGLALHRVAGAFRVPEVIAHAEATEHYPAYLIMEWIDSNPNPDQEALLANVGRAMAALHRVTWSAFGLDHDNYAGNLPQYNTPTASWPAFYRDQRVKVQMEIARKLGYLPPHREALLNKVLDRVEDILKDANNPPSLLHGDLWPGNFMAIGDNQPVIVDPALYYGDREVEIANTQTFGGMPPQFLDAYQELYPLDPGYEYRRPLLQLTPLLVHLNHFGEEYGPGVDELCRHYVTN